MKPSAVCSVMPKMAHHASWIGFRRSKGDEARKLIWELLSGHRVVAAPGEGVATRDA
jgi:hypothetical protein